MKLDNFTNSKPASFTRVIYENVVLSDTHILQVVPMEKYIESYILQVNPFIAKYTNEPIWDSFFKKYDIMCRERILMAMRNCGR